MKSTKTGERRTTRLLSVLYEDLERYYIACGSPLLDSLILPGVDDEHGWTKSNWQTWRARHWGKACKLAGLVPVPRPYDLRHSSVSLMLAEGHRLHYIAKQHGTSERLILETYGHLFDEYEGADPIDAEAEIRAARTEVAKLVEAAGSSTGVCGMCADQGRRHSRFLTGQRESPAFEAVAQTPALGRGLCCPGGLGRCRGRCYRGGPAVGQNFLSCDREQELLLPPSLRDWLPDGHLAWFVLDAVEAIDLAAFHASYRADGWGRAAHDPAMMVALLLYAYAVGERSSRAIERRCREDIAFRVICANQTPDHATIARFRVRHEQALADTFTQVLALCGRAGLVAVGTVAIDGTLIAANASRAATRTHTAIREEVDRILADAAATDAAEDAEHGDGRGDELPPELTDRRSRLARLRRCREELEAEQAAEQAAHEANLRRRAEWEAEHGRKLGGRKPTPPDPDALADRRANVTDPDSRLLRRAGRTPVQGYNAQLATGPGQIIVAADLTQQANDSGQLEPMTVQALETLHTAKADPDLKIVLADGGYWNSPQIRRLRQRGLQPIVPTKAAARTRPRTLSPRQGAEADRIDRLLATPEGQALYRRRQQLVEPVFAHTKFLRGITRFQRRGLTACQAEWRLIAAAHNLLKLWRATTATA